MFENIDLKIADATQGSEIVPIQTLACSKLCTKAGCSTSGKLPC